MSRGVCPASLLGLRSLHALSELVVIFAQTLLGFRLLSTGSLQHPGSRGQADPEPGLQRRWACSAGGRGPA